MLTEEAEKWRIQQAHAYLERIRKMGDDCAALQQEVEDARDRADGIKGIDYSRDRVSSSPTDDAMVNAVESIRAAIKDYVTKLSELLDERKRASDAINEMEDFTEAKALRLRYILCNDWESVCVKMHYSWDGMMKLRRRALLSYSYVMPERPVQSEAIMDADFYSST